MTCLKSVTAPVTEYSNLWMRKRIGNCFTFPTPKKREELFLFPENLIKVVRSHPMSASNNPAPHGSGDSSTIFSRADEVSNVGQTMSTPG